MKKLFLFLMLCGLQSLFSQDLSLKIDSLIYSHQEANQFPGMVLVAQNDEVRYAKGLGWAKANTPIDGNTPFPVASINRAPAMILSGIIRIL